ncbi:ketopantoate hydroxymethyltransferase-domain-containing protein [Pelagophyceae sp. CCMP2097]|nr:ketopantoate hydroxymethyltransferase-domain-containing protein [Pelagophyceae sp. CCMP2097]
MSLALGFARRALRRRPLSTAAAEPRRTKTVTAMELQRMKRVGTPITMVTAYDYPSAMHVDAAGVDVVLCGDSVGMVALGYTTTQPVTLDEMLHHSRAVRRGLSLNGAPLLVCDLPFGSYEESPEVAMRSAYRCLKEGSADAIKLEGGTAVCESVRRIVQGGIAVMGHVGLTPQSISTLGGFRAQGRTAVKARKVVDDALALQDAGAFAVVVECVPAAVGRAVAAALEIPTIGIGAGQYCDGQVLVYHDLLGSINHPHHQRFVPNFCKLYADVGEKSITGIKAFKADVISRSFPSEAYSPYTMPPEEAEKFAQMLQDDVDRRDEKKRAARKRIVDDDEYETIKLY